MRPEISALTRARLAWIQQSYIRADTITTANNRLVDVHAALPLTKALGGGELASADGIRFVVPVRSVHAGANPKYFGRCKGVTYINYTSAGSIGFFGFVVPGTLRDSMVILDGLLEQHTSLRPTTLVTDSASYSDIVFGLFTFARLPLLPAAGGSGRDALLSHRPDRQLWTTQRHCPSPDQRRSHCPQLGRSAACSRLTQARLCGCPRSDVHLPGQRSKLYPGARVG